MGGSADPAEGVSPRSGGIGESKQSVGARPADLYWLGIRLILLQEALDTHAVLNIAPIHKDTDNRGFPYDILRNSRAVAACRRRQNGELAQRRSRT
jgi:hypothetical protein